MGDGRGGDGRRTRGRWGTDAGEWGIKDHKMTGAANKDSLEEHGWEQAICMLPGKVLRDAHRGYECDLCEDALTDLYVHRRHDGKSPLRNGCVALQSGVMDECLDFGLLAARKQDRIVAAGIQ